MILGLEGRGVLVTGGSKGIGLACTRAQAKIPLKRCAAPDEIANLALFLASDKAGYLTGAIIPMDGGSNPVV